MTRQNGKAAIVTGASRGIGAAVAERLASDGFNLVINHAGRPEEAEAQVGRIRQSGGTAVAVRADVSNPADIRHLFDAAEEQFGHVDVLVNNAGIMQLSTLERLGQPADIAGVVAFLAGPDGGWINGQVLRANGGIV